MSIFFAARARWSSSMTREAEALLSRYPGLDAKERERLERILPALPLVDQAVLTADEHLSGRLAAFYRDRRECADAPSGALFLFLLCPTLLATAALWWFLG